MKPNTLTEQDRHIACNAEHYATTVRFRDRTTHTSKEDAMRRLSDAGSGCLYAVATVAGCEVGALIATLKPNTGWTYL